MKSFYIGVKGIILQDNKVLLLKKIGQETYFWDAPGGRIDEGEEIEDALVRELKEEIGSNNFSISKLLAVHKVANFVGENHDLLLVFYLLKGKIEEVKISPEHQDYIWVSKDEIEMFLNKEKDHLNNGTLTALRKAFSQ